MIVVISAFATILLLILVAAGLTGLRFLFSRNRRVLGLSMLGCLAAMVGCMLFAGIFWSSSQSHPSHVVHYGDVEVPLANLSQPVAIPEYKQFTPPQSTVVGEKVAAKHVEIRNGVHVHHIHQNGRDLVIVMSDDGKLLRVEPESAVNRRESWASELLNGTESVVEAEVQCSVDDRDCPEIVATRPEVTEESFADIDEDELSVDDEVQTEASTEDEIERTIEKGEESPARPGWVDTRPRNHDGNKSRVVVSDAALSRRESEKSLMRDIRSACENAVRQHLVNSDITDVWRVPVSPKMIEVARHDSFNESRETSQGSATVMHELLVFDERFDRLVDDGVRRQRVRSRLEITGSVSAMAIGGVSAIFALSAVGLRWQNRRRK